jgi:hypothetical protein
MQDWFRLIKSYRLLTGAEFQNQLSSIPQQVLQQMMFSEHCWNRSIATHYNTTTITTINLEIHLCASLTILVGIGRDSGNINASEKQRQSTRIDLCQMTGRPRLLRRRTLFAAAEF